MKLAHFAAGALIAIIISFAAFHPPKSFTLELKKNTTMTLLEPWNQAETTTIIAANSANNDSKKSTLNKPSYKAAYSFIDTNKNEDFNYGFIAIHDPDNHRYYFCDAGHDIYVVNKNEIEGYTLIPTGELIWSTDYFHIPDNTPLNSFDQKFNNLIRIQDIKQKWNDRLMTRLSVNDGLPRRFFCDFDAPGGMLVTPKINFVEINTNAMTITFENPVSKKSASVTIDIKSKRVIKTTLIDAR